MLKITLSKALICALIAVVITGFSQATAEIPAPVADIPAPVVSDLEEFVIATDASTEIAEESATIIPAVGLQKKVEPFVKDYIDRNEELLTYIKKSKGHYFKTIDKVFIQYGIPVEMKYLAVIESNLKTTALSRVGARGMWQLMPETATALGLKVNSKVDERTYAYKSTVAAAKYLNDLYNLFGDWLLVIAAYNSGPGYVYKAIAKTGSREFWDIQNHLPRETRMHVKKFIATHYFYEGSGSMVTLTKSETKKYQAYIAQLKRNDQESQQSTRSTTEASLFRWVAVINNQNEMLVVGKK